MNLEEKKTRNKKKNGIFGGALTTDWGLIALVA